MTETNTDAPQVEDGELPVIEAPQTVQAAVFTPNQFDMPSANDLTNILMIAGIIRLGPVAGVDKQQNLVDAKGQIVVPATLRRFFQVASLEVAQGG